MTYKGRDAIHGVRKMQIAQFFIKQRRDAIHGDRMATANRAGGKKMRKAVQSIIAFLMAAVFTVVSVQFPIYTMATFTTPADPQNVKAVSVSYNSVKISWSAVSGATGYILYRYNSAKKTYGSLATVKTTSYTNTGLLTGTTYYYKTRAYKTISGKNSYGSYSAAASAKPIPSVPGSFKALPVNSTSVKLSWNAVSGASGYILYRYNAATKIYNRIKATAALSYTNTGLAAWGIYTYKLRAYRIVNGTNIYGNLTASLTNPSELEGVAPQRLAFTKKMLNVWSHDYTVESFINRKQIINWGKTGKGLQVIDYENGTPALALINFDKTTTGYFNDCLSDMKKYDVNYLKEITANGAVAVMIDGNGDGSFTYNKYGLIDWMLSKENYNNVNKIYLEQGILVESFGVRMENLGGDYSKYEGFLKEALASDCWWNLWKKTGSSVCKENSFDHYICAKEFYGDIYSPVKFKDKKIQDLLKNVRSKNLASAFGGSWSQITASIKDRPDWKSGDPV